MSKKHLSILSVLGVLAFGTAPAQADSLWENFLNDAGKVVDKVDVFSDDDENPAPDTSESTSKPATTPNEDAAKTDHSSGPSTATPATPSANQPAASANAQVIPKPKPVRPSAVVKQAQALLSQLGYDPGPADGLYGKRTGRAISVFQKDRGVVVSGDVTEELIAQLQEARSEKIAAAEEQPDAVAALQPKSDAPTVVSEEDQSALADADNPEASVAETDSPIPAIAADVRTFDFRGIRLGDSLEDVAAALPSMRIETDAGENNVIIGYRGLWTAENKKDVIRVTFTHDGRLYSLNNGQTLSPSLTAETLFSRIVKKYGDGEPTEGTLIYQTDDPEIDQARFNVNIRSASDGTYVAINLFDSKLARKSDEAVEAAKLAAKSRIAKDLKL